MNPEQNKRKKYFAIGAILIAAAIATAFFVMRRGGGEQVAIDHLIQGVPPYTLYNTYMDMEATYLTAIMTVAGYWGDSSVTLNGLRGELGTTSMSPTKVTQFFNAKGYVVNAAVSEQGTFPELDVIRTYVAQDIPVIVRQRRTTNESDIAGGYRVVIGVNDSAKTVTVHDYIYGNNYEISQPDFQRMFQLARTNNAVIAVWPSDALKAKLGTPNRPAQYPARDASMRAVGDLWMIRANALEYGYQGDLQKSVDMLKVMVVKEEFSKLIPPAYQYGVYDCLTRRLFGLKKWDEVIEFTTKKMAPINKDLNAPFTFWTGQMMIFDRLDLTTKDRFVNDYFWAGRAYQTVGKNAEAKAMFGEGMRLEPAYYDKVLVRYKAILAGVLSAMKSVGAIE